MKCQKKNSSRLLCGQAWRMLELATVLNEPQTNIEGLSLRYIKLSDEACSALADAIKVNWTLGRFELHGTIVHCCTARLDWCGLTLLVAVSTCSRQPDVCRKLREAC